ncbi:hypothetical protein PPERSA_09584 [Pseudocohnilembus persalinus]|uniref:Uncharacterized protein n=1 Tax=Pseudocohnilembus persalinus TaxID=266149 RepID=A0A0V0QFJ7_PSEPJ|nr:hypothetical protein PPERSA_09584 [Pseudocohnilembus persalinus]|eukprot:KRX00978.1 hypothetical protein PPERSA_09584 [Pseudocohnilembus persalinus]
MMNIFQKNNNKKEENNENKNANQQTQQMQKLVDKWFDEDLVKKDLELVNQESQTIEQTQNQKIEGDFEQVEQLQKNKPTYHSEGEEFDESDFSNNEYDKELQVKKQDIFKSKMQKKEEKQGLCHIF